MIKAILFDMDDVLYDESMFFKGGFASVAEQLVARGYCRDKKMVVQLLTRFHREDRSRVLQQLADVLDFPRELIPALAEVVRRHPPALVLAADAVEVLPRLRQNFKLGCVTDGWAAVQRAKIAALRLAPLLDNIVITDELGREYWKPHPKPFLVCCQNLGVKPEETIMVGDNPERDQRGAEQAGIGFVRMLRPGSYYEKTESVFGSLSPIARISSLHELENVMNKL